MNTATVTSVIDPVCGMSIDPADAAATSRFSETTFHFCAPACKAAFDAAPAKYVSIGEPAASCCTTGGHCA